MNKELQLGTVEWTSRGFEIVEFDDHYGVKCSLQMSSLADHPDPGTSAIWLGCNDANPRTLVPGEGWKPFPMPQDYLADTRMHLNQDQVKALLVHLKHWIEHGSFAPQKSACVTRTWDIPDNVHAAVSNLLDENLTLKKKVEVALEMEQSVRSENNSLRAQLQKANQAIEELKTALDDILNDSAVITPPAASYKDDFVDLQIRVDHYDAGFKALEAVTSK